MFNDFLIPHPVKTEDQQLEQVNRCRSNGDHERRHHGRNYKSNKNRLESVRKNEHHI